MTEKERARRKEKYEDYKLAYAALMLCYPFTLEDLDGEIWRAVEYYPERYHISNYGRLKSFYNGVAKILKPSLHNCGYLYFELYKNGNAKNARFTGLLKRRSFRIPKICRQ